MPYRITKVLSTPGGYAVAYRGRMCSPRWTNPAAAEAYILLCESGHRKPEYEPGIREKRKDKTLCPTK